MPKTSLDRFEQRKLTRAKLIDAALQLFSTSGYEHATVDDISQAAGYSKGAYYFHFSTKEDILLELLRMWTEGRQTVLDAVADETLTAQGLQDAVEEFLSYSEEPRWPAVLLEFWSQALRNEEVSRRLSQAYGAWRNSLTRIIETGARAGLTVDAPGEAAAVILAAHDGYAVQVAIKAYGGKQMTPAEVAQSIVAPLTEQVAAPERKTSSLR